MLQCRSDQIQTKTMVSLSPLVKPDNIITTQLLTGIFMDVYFISEAAEDASKDAAIHTSAA